MNILRTYSSASKTGFAFEMQLALSTLLCAVALASDDHVPARERKASFYGSCVV
jgi:hypothetical protein